jgi:hypothetical protein
MFNKKQLIFLVVSFLIFSGVISAQDIFDAIGQDDIAKVKMLLEQDPGLINAERFRRHPLDHASILRKRAIAELLISKGADINRETIGGFNPVIWAVRNNDLEMIEMFVSKGADINKTTTLGESYLHFAAFYNKKRLVEYLIDKGLDVNIVKNGNLTPLHIAAVLGYRDIIEVLVKRGADLNIKSTDGGTPLHYAAAARNKDIEAFLISKGAKELRRTFPEYKGAYLGKKRPGTEPEPFAPELFRNIYRTHSAPAFSPDGKELYWEAIFMKGNNNASRVWFMKEENGKWTAPAVAPFSDYPSGGPAFLPNGKKLFYSSLRSRNGGTAPASDLDLWYVERIGNKWTDSKNLGPNVNSDDIHEVLPDVAKDGTLYYGVAGIKGVAKSAFVNGKYSKREIIGDLFESDIIDSCKDKDFLIYMSDKRKSRFHYELFVSFHKPDGRWSEPVFLGDKLHQGFRLDLGSVSLDGKYLFFSKNFSFYWIDAKFIEDLKPDGLK